MKKSKQLNKVFFLIKLSLLITLSSCVAQNTNTTNLKNDLSSVSTPVMSDNQNVVFDLKQKKNGATITVKINSSDFKTKSEAGFPPKTSADVKSFQIYLIKKNVATYPTGGDPLADVVSGPFPIVKTGTTFQTITFSNVDNSAGSYYFAGVRAYDISNVELIKHSNGGIPWTGSTTDPNDRIAVSTNSVTVNSSLQVSTSFGLIVNINLDATGANIDGAVKTTPFQDGSSIGASLSTSGVLDTVAGYTNTLDISPDLVTLNNPNSLFIDYMGNIYISDAGNNRILKVFKNTAKITIFAGTGTLGNTGDGEQATNATFSGPQGIWGDNSGNIYICDSGNNRIRKINSSGFITNFSGDSNGATGNNGDGGQATNATLANPSALWGDNLGNIYIADNLNNRIRKVDSSGVINNFAGDISGTGGNTGDGGQATNATLNYPQGILGDNSGNIYIVDNLNNRIRKVNPSGIIDNFAGDVNGTNGNTGDGGLATNATLNSPQVIWGDNSGNIYIADNLNNRIRKVDSSGVIDNFAGDINGTSGNSGDGGLATNATLNSPHGIWGDNSGNIYFIDVVNNRLRKISNTNIISNFSGLISKNTGDGGQATKALLSNPWSVWLDNSGNLFISDYLNNRIRKVDPSGIITNFAGNSGGSDGNTGDGGQATLAMLANPKGIWGDNAGNIYIADSTNNRIRKIDSTGIINNFAGDINGTSGNTGDGGQATSATLNQPNGLWGDSSGNIYISDNSNHRIRKVAPTGIITNFAGNAGALQGNSADGILATNARLRFPGGVWGDNTGNIYIADTFNNRIRKVNASNIISNFAGSSASTPGNIGDGGQAISARFNFPGAVWGDGSGNIYVADTNNNRIRKINSSGIITNFAGNSGGVDGKTGDGGQASGALFFQPQGLSGDSLGNLYIADTNNDSVRAVFK